MDAQREPNGVIRVLIPRGKRSEMIRLADFSQGFGRKPNERARSKRAAVRSEQLVQHANSAGKTSISVARFSPIKSRATGVSWNPRRGSRKRRVNRAVDLRGRGRIHPAESIDAPSRDIEDEVKINTGRSPSELRDSSAMRPRVQVKITDLALHLSEEGGDYP